MILSYDIDNTLTNHPELAEIASAMQAMGHRNIVLTGRKTDAGIKELLHSIKFPEDVEIITKANDKTTTRAFKERVLREQAVDLHFDNDLDLPALHPTKVVAFRQSSIRFGRFTR